MTTYEEIIKEDSIVSAIKLYSDELEARGYEVSVKYAEDSFVRLIIKYNDVRIIDTYDRIKAIASYMRGYVHALIDVKHFNIEL